MCLKDFYRLGSRFLMFLVCHLTGSINHVKLTGGSDGYFLELSQISAIAIRKTRLGDHIAWIN